MSSAHSTIVRGASIVINCDVMGSAVEASVKLCRQCAMKMLLSKHANDFENVPYSSSLGIVKMHLQSLCVPSIQ